MQDGEVRTSSFRDHAHIKILTHSVVESDPEELVFNQKTLFGFLNKSYKNKTKHQNKSYEK